MPALGDVFVVGTEEQPGTVYDIAWKPVDGPLPQQAPTSGGPQAPLQDLHYGLFYAHTLDVFVLGCGPRSVALRGRAYAWRGADRQRVQGYQLHERPDCPIHAWVAIQSDAPVVEQTVGWQELSALAQPPPADLIPEPQRAGVLRVGGHQVLLAWRGDQQHHFVVERDGRFRPLGALRLADHPRASGGPLPYGVCIGDRSYVVDQSAPSDLALVALGDC